MEQTPRDGVLCFAHLRWNFVCQRPQHLMTRLAARRRVVYFEEPELGDSAATLALRDEGDVTVARISLPADISAEESIAVQRRFVDEFLRAAPFEAPPLLWYYTPMALPFTRHLEGLRIYDCMDQLAAFKNAPAQIEELERELLGGSALVFTGGRSLYYAKRRLHSNVHCYPSAVDASHFAPAGRSEPPELRLLKHPRMIFCGVIDERLDISFLEQLCAELSDWSLCLVGPVVKIDPAGLPEAPNLHYFGMRSYEELPALLEHCEVALIPFALNDATRFISPTKTLEYLAARKPVISTPIADVVDPFGTEGLVSVAQTAQQAALYARAALAAPRSPAWDGAVARALEQSSWDETVADMERRIAEASVLNLEAAG